MCLLSNGARINIGGFSGQLRLPWNYLNHYCGVRPVGLHPRTSVLTRSQWMLSAKLRCYSVLQKVKQMETSPDGLYDDENTADAPRTPWIHPERPSNSCKHKARLPYSTILEIRMSTTPEAADVQISDRISGSPDFRKSGFPKFRISVNSGIPAFRKSGNL